MNADHYLLARDENLPAYYFASEGIKGKIQKGIFFQLINEEQQLYNLAFGDLDTETGRLDDVVRTDNHDTQKVLNTVSMAVIDFMDVNPDVKLLATGSTRSRTRLYQMNIVRNLQEISERYAVQGLKNGRLEAFQLGVNYDAFLLTRRLLTL